jgi:serine/threonine protein kinase
LARSFEKFVVLGQFADSYTQKEGLGQGKYGKVFSVIQNQTKKEFAVKYYSTKKLFDDNFQKCVLYEIDRMRDISVKENLSCLKLVKLYEGQNYIYCINEVLKGGELREAMRDRPGFSEFEILRIIYQVIAGVNFLESKGLVHRDIKASNIVFRKKDDISDPVLIDFGFCLRYEDIDKKNTTHGYCSGTPGFLAPEMLSGSPYTSKADVFSVGCLMFYLMTYIPPFYGPNKESI